MKRRSKRNGVLRALFILVVCVLVVIAFARIFARFKARPLLNVAQPITGQVPKATKSAAVSIQEAFTQVADIAGPSVVTISTERMYTVPGHPNVRGFGGQWTSPGQEDLFNRFLEKYFGLAPEQEQVQMGLGTGFIFDARGYILTNNHVVEDAHKIKVTLPDGRSFDGIVKGSDKRSDLAVIEVEAKDLPVARLGDSDTVRTGEWVIALGNPFGHVLRSPNPTVTVGVISALHRHIPSANAVGVHFDMIQTDAAINPGNSGGPLCNINGEVIGINLAIFSTSGGYQGIGFAIPVNRAKEILDDLMSGDTISYGWFGVQGQEVSEDIAEYFNLPDTNGVLIAQVLEGAPAHMAGLLPGDILRKFNGRVVKDPYMLGELVGQTEPREVVSIDFIRDRVPMKVPVTIGSWPEDENMLVGAGDTGTDEASPFWRGISVSNITDYFAAQLELPDKQGVIIVKVDPASQFYAIGVREGVVIKEINRNPINSVDDFTKITREAKGKVLIRTDRGYIIVR